MQERSRDLGVLQIPVQSQTHRIALQRPKTIGSECQTKTALRENSWKSTPIEGVAGNLVIQQERLPSETVAKSPSIRLFRAFV